MTACLALFRGINVGGRQVVKMDDLADLHVSLGLRDVSTYIQSGNVVFASDDADVDAHSLRIAEAFEQRFSFHSEVIVRTSADLAAIIAKNPFQGQPSRESKWVVVMFLTARPEDAAQADLLASSPGPEEMHIIGQELYCYYPEGIGRSRLTGAFIERKLKTFGTARNWNTVLKLDAMLRSLPH
jgi:uncharacterized protein (DUF1697 family)